MGEFIPGEIPIQQIGLMMAGKRTGIIGVDINIKNGVLENI